MPSFAPFYRQLLRLRFADIVASMGLMRPAPLQDGLADEYHARACGKNAADFYDGRLAPILEETYGLVIYQEQLMAIAKMMCGFTAGQAEDLRAALFSGDENSVCAIRDEWVAGAAANGYDEREARMIWDYSTPNAKALLFCKAHAVAYATLVMWTAYLKAHFPTEFTEAVHTLRMDEGLAS